MKIVVLDGYTVNPGDLNWDGLKEFGDLTVYDRTPKALIIERIGDAEIVFTNKTLVTKETLEACKSVKYVGVLATGYNVVDLEYAKERGIVVTNIPNYGTNAVAQMTFALLLEVANHVGFHSDLVKQGEWIKSVDFCFWKTPLMELHGKTMGIIGFGAIGQATAKIAAAFGLNVLAYSRTPNLSLETENIKIVSDISKLYNQADIISLHCPLSAENAQMINKNAISQMKDGVIILNTARGGLINEVDLAEALNSGKVYAAAVDVVSAEPIHLDNPLLSAKNCIITPHISWAPREARARLLDIAVSNLAKYLSGDVQNRV